MQRLQNISLIAFYLPQYHPISENDRWWGKGFTEWTNATRAKPLFSGHYQPHLPADLGFYDLRLPETRKAQAELAKLYGVYGFCYYHYWFHGKHLLEHPFNEVLMSGEPDFPFCLCWANENWTRQWDGCDQEILIEQAYSEEDDRLHIQWLAKAFHDSRYIRIDDKPLFLVYRASKLPDPLRTTAIWRSEAERLGIGDLYLCRVESRSDECSDPASVGFDAAVEFQPDWGGLGLPLQTGRRWDVMRKLKLAESAYASNRIYDYATIVKQMLAKALPGYTRFPCVVPNWDNTARRNSGGAIVLHNSTPDAYETWLRTVIQREVAQEQSKRVIFINAWNEWAEGSHLEPCQKWGHAYLEATRRALLEVELSINSIFVEDETHIKKLVHDGTVQ